MVCQSRKKKNWCPEYFCIHHTHTHTHWGIHAHAHTRRHSKALIWPICAIYAGMGQPHRVLTKSKDMFFFHCISIHGKVLLNHSWCKRQVCRTGWGPLKAATHSSPCTQSLCVIPKKPSISPPSSSVPHHTVCSVHKPARPPKTTNNILCKYQLTIQR